MSCPTVTTAARLRQHPDTAVQDGHIEHAVRTLMPAGVLTPQLILMLTLPRPCRALHSDGDLVHIDELHTRT